MSSERDPSLPPLDLQHFISLHLGRKRRLHDDGECAAIDCPYCEYEEWTGTGRYRLRQPKSERAS